MADYQMFEPLYSGEQCAKLLPLNDILHTIYFYRVTTFFEPIYLSNFRNDDDPPEAINSLFPQPDQQSIVNATMGLSLAFVNPAYERCTRRREVKVQTPDGQHRTLVVGFDKTFLPSNDPSAVLRRPIERVSVDDPEIIREGQTRLDGKRLATSQATKDMLLESGEAYVLVDGTKEIVRLTLNLREYEIPDLQELLTHKAITVGDRRLRVELSDQDKEKLLSRGEAIARVDGHPAHIRFQPARPRATADDAQRWSYGTIEDALENYLEDTFGPQSPSSSHPNNSDLPRYIQQLEDCLNDERYDIYFDGIEMRYDETAIAEIDRSYIGRTQLFLRDPRASWCMDFLQDKPADKVELPAYEIGILTKYRQDWKLLGYSRGTLLSSLTLAPREEVTIEVFAWDRLKVEEEKTFGVEYESNREISVLSNSASAIAHDLNETLGCSAGLTGGVSIPIEGVPVNLDVSGDASSNVETSIHGTLDLLNESTLNSAERFKATHGVKIVETHEMGEETRTTRKFQNPNSARTLTLNHYEVLENFEVTTSVVDNYRDKGNGNNAGLGIDKQFCLLVENEDFSIDIDFVLAYQNVLERVLLSPCYKSGFSAARILAGQRWFDEDGKLKEELRTQDLQPATTTSAAAQTPDEKFPSHGVFGTALQTKKKLEKFIKLSPKKMRDVLKLLGEHCTTPFWEESKYTSKQVNAAKDAVKQYSFWVKVSMAYPGFDTRAGEFVARMKELDRQKADYSQQQLQDEVVLALGSLVDTFDDEWLCTIKMLAVSTVVATILASAVSPVIALIVGPYLAPLVMIHDDAGLPGLIARARKELKTIRDTQAIKSAELAFPQPVAQSGDGASSQLVAVGSLPVPQLYSLSDLAAAQADFRALRLHLESNRVYYQNEIWRVEAPNQRLFRLNLKGVAGHVENRLLGFAGKKAIYPLRVSVLPDSVHSELKLYCAYTLHDIPLKTETVTLPTPSVHMEPMLGQCDAIEDYLQQRREIDLQLRQAEADKLVREAQAVAPTGEITD